MLGGDATTAVANSGAREQLRGGTTGIAFILPQDGSADATLGAAAAIGMSPRYFDGAKSYWNCLPTAESPGPFVAGQDVKLAALPIATLGDTLKVIRRQASPVDRMRTKKELASRILSLEFARLARAIVDDEILPAEREDAAMKLARWADLLFERMLLPNDPFVDDSLDAEAFHPVAVPQAAAPDEPKTTYADRYKQALQAAGGKYSYDVSRALVGNDDLNSYLRQLECGAIPTRELNDRIAAFLQVDPEWLMFGRGKPS